MSSKKVDEKLIKTLEQLQYLPYSIVIICLSTTAGNLWLKVIGVVLSLGGAIYMSREIKKVTETLGNIDS
ncbi:MAG: hypothetical protein KDD35_03560 [Bdellovibrionales bacterium]|nr:hypothetical protein [Bdellovibrionales bacterium]